MKHANIAIFVPHIGCPNQCSFCNQRSISGQQNAPTPEDVKNACEQAVREIDFQNCTAELAFFGGSFTAIERNYMLSLLEATVPYIGNNKIAGIRLSTRPDAINKEILRLLLHYGVTAVELGVQSMDDEVLSANHRGHTASDVEKACALIHESGIELGLQMMTGLYCDSHQKDMQTAYKLAALHPDTVRIYPTILIKGTPLEELYKQGLYNPESLESAVDLGSELLEFFLSKNIRVIRLGLHASGTLEGDMIAGPYHPAFRELCEGEIYLRLALSEMSDMPKNKQIIIFVSPKSVSKMIGQKRKNILKLEQLGYSVIVKPLENLNEFEIKI